MNISDSIKLLYLDRYGVYEDWEIDLVHINSHNKVLDEESYLKARWYLKSLRSLKDYEIGPLIVIAGNYLNKEKKVTTKIFEYLKLESEEAGLFLPNSLVFMSSPE